MDRAKHKNHDKAVLITEGQQNLFGIDSPSSLASECHEKSANVCHLNAADKLTSIENFSKIGSNKTDKLTSLNEAIPVVNIYASEQSNRPTVSNSNNFIDREEERKTGQYNGKEKANTSTVDQINRIYTIHDYIEDKGATCNNASHKSNWMEPARGTPISGKVGKAQKQSCYEEGHGTSRTLLNQEVDEENCREKEQLGVNITAKQQCGSEVTLKKEVAPEISDDSEQSDYILLKTMNDEDVKRRLLCKIDTFKSHNDGCKKNKIISTIKRDTLNEGYCADEDPWVRQSALNITESRPTIQKDHSQKFIGKCDDAPHIPQSIIEENISEESSTTKSEKSQLHTAAASTVTWVTQKNPWLLSGVKARAHIKLQRAVSTDALLSNIRNRSNVGGRKVNINETMKAFHEIQHSPTAPASSSSSSTPDISVEKPLGYLKKIRSLVNFRRSKSSTELMNASSAELEEKSLSTPVSNVNDVTLKDRKVLSLDSSTESLSDELSTVKAKQEILKSSVLDDLTEDQDENESDEGNNHDSDDNSDDSDISKARGKNGARHTGINSLPVPKGYEPGQRSASVTGFHASIGSQRKLLLVSQPADVEIGTRKSKRQRSISETNYSLLRPDRETSQQDIATVTFTRIPSIRHSRFHARLKHHLHVTCDDDDLDDLHTLKDAVHLTPLETGEVIITDILSNKLVVFDGSGRPKVTFAVETGSEPWATCMTSNGNLAVTLKRQGCVSLWSPSGEPISEFGHDDLSGPAGIICDDIGRFIVADEENDSVLVFKNHGQFLFELPRAGTASDETAVKTRVDNQSFSGAKQTNQKSPTYFSKPRYVCCTESGGIAISDSANHCVALYDSALKLIGQIGSYGRCDGLFKFPYGVAYDRHGYLFVADYFNNRVSLFSKDGVFLEHILTAQNQITRPKALAVRDDLLYVSYGDLRANKVAVFKIKPS